MPPFNTVDIIIMALLGIGVLRGSMRGLSGELASVISLVVAAVAGWHFYRPLGEYLADTTRMTNVQADTVSFVVIIGGALILLWALSIVLKSIMEFTFKGWLERVGGGVMGVVRYALLLAAALLIIAQFSSGAVRQHVIKESLIGQHALERLVPLYEDLVQRYPELPALTGAEEAADLDEPEMN